MFKQSFRLILTISLFLISCLLLALAPASVSAEGFRITPFLGYRAGGDFEDGGTGAVLSLSEEETYGIILNKETKPGFDAEFYYSFQPAHLIAGGAVTPGVLAEVDVEYFHLGGRQYWDKGAIRTFVVASAGATHFSSDASNLESDTRFSIGLGGGVELGGEGRIGLRLEGRGFATFFNENSGILCGSQGGCVILMESNFFLQYEVGAGVTFKF